MDLDEETKVELLDAFNDLYHDAERGLAELLSQPSDKALNSLFRAIHNIKGNAGLMRLDAIVDFTHQIEEVAGALRQKRFPLCPAIADALLIALDRVHDLHQQELFGKRFEYLRIDELKVLFGALAQASSCESEGIAQQILRFMGAGIDVSNIDIFSVPANAVVDVQVSTPYRAVEERLDNDLFFFQEMALELDNQMPEWDGRSLQLFDWAMKMNDMAGTPVDPLQFAAAIYMHDIGMSFMPRELWHCKLDTNPEDIAIVAKHPDRGYQILSRIPGWQDAATIVLHHHECIDGSGYPNGLAGSHIHTGAKILAILDAFFYLTKGRVDASNRQSTVRAVSAINTRIDTAFEGLWVQCFNHMIRKELRLGNI